MRRRLLGECSVEQKDYAGKHGRNAPLEDKRQLKNVKAHVTIRLEPT